MRTRGLKTIRGIDRSIDDGVYDYGLIARVARNRTINEMLAQEVDLISLWFRDRSLRGMCRECSVDQVLIKKLSR